MSDVKHKSGHLMFRTEVAIELSMKYDQRSFEGNTHALRVTFKHAAFCHIAHATKAFVLH